VRPYRRSRCHCMVNIRSPLVLCPPYTIVLAGLCAKELLYLTYEAHQITLPRAEYSNTRTRLTERRTPASQFELSITHSTPLLSPVQSSPVPFPLQVGSCSRNRLACPSQVHPVKLVTTLVSCSSSSLLPTNTRRR